MLHNLVFSDKVVVGSVPGLTLRDPESSVNQAVCLVQCVSERERERGRQVPDGAAATDRPLAAHSRFH